MADCANNEIRQIAIATGVVSLLAGSPTGAFGNANGTGTAASFWDPNGITTDGANLYVADWANGEIRLIAIATGAVSLLAGSPTGAVGNADGTGTAASFVGPRGIATDGTNLYVEDGDNEIRQIVIATGVVSLLAGSPTGAAGNADGTGTAASSSNPFGITTDGTNLYATDEGNNEIRQIVIATGAVGLLAGSSKGGKGIANGTGTAASFWFPLGITTDGINLYVVDANNCEIRTIR